MWKRTPIYVLLVLLIPSSIKGVPLDTCAKQHGCLNIYTWVALEGTDSEGNGQYDMCLYWEHGDDCPKEDEISYAVAWTTDDTGLTLASEKKEDWSFGETNERCVTVSCDGTAFFGVKDGRDCYPGPGDNLKDDGSETFSPFDDYPSDVEDPICWADYFESHDMKDVVGGNTKACVWQIPAPACVILLHRPQTMAQRSQLVNSKATVLIVSNERKLF
eukprot:1143432_1